jgi:hypothetical protein
VKSPQHTINATGILRYSNANNNTTITYDKINPSQMLFHKSPPKDNNIISPQRKSKIEAKMKKLSQNDRDDDTL